MMTPAGFEHGNTEANLIAALSNWNRVHRAGRIVSGDTGFILERNPDTVRAPDVAFVGKDRLPDELPRVSFQVRRILPLRSDHRMTGPETFERRSKIICVWTCKWCGRSTSLHAT